VRGKKFLVWATQSGYNSNEYFPQNDPFTDFTEVFFMQYPVVTLKTAHGTIEIELYPDVAPNTVNNFISLIKKGFYDGTTFHRVIPKFMIQGGDPKGNGTGGPGYSIRGEFTSNHFKNDLKHTRGVISMARTVNPNSAGSQFFIMVDDAPYLDGEYAAFGRVTSGMEEVDRIVSVPRDYDDRPLEEEKIVSVTVETFGETYDEPKKV
jgi:peptidyl-prolyl cis-trans isomerase B (cyclophilin B)